MGKKKKDIIKIDQVQRRAAQFVENYYRIYIKEKLQYNSVKNDMGWNDLLDRRRNIFLTLYYKIVNYEGIIISAKGRTIDKSSTQ